MSLSVESIQFLLVSILFFSIFWKKGISSENGKKRWETVTSGAKEIKKQETLVRFSTVSYKKGLSVVVVDDRFFF